MKAKKNSWTTNGMALALVLGTVLAATAIAIPVIELGAGVADKPGCLDTAVVNFETSMQGNLSGVTVNNIGPDCAGKWVRLSLFSTADGTGTPIEQVVWQMPAATTPPVTSYTAQANGSTTGVVSSVVWPNDETGAAGLAQTLIASSSVNSFNLETSDSAITDGP